MCVLIFLFYLHIIIIMSDYVSMGSIQLKNKILTPRILDLYRSGDLNLSSIQGTVNPLVEVYRDTYNYIDFPQLSEPAKKLIMQPSAIATGIKPLAQPNIISNQVTPAVPSVNGQFNGPVLYGPMTSKNLTDPKFTYDYTTPLVYRAPKNYTVV